MTDTSWPSATWDGNRHLQHQAFMALSFREKIQEIERMGEVLALFESRRAKAGPPVRDAVAPRPPGG